MRLYQLKHGYSLSNNHTDNKIFKALIVEDDVDICYLLSGILRQKKLATSSVNTLKDAMRELESNKPDIVILDNHLPDGLGVEFIAYIKQYYPLTHIILITAHDTVTDRTKAIDMGADYFIGKPFTRAVMNHTLENLIH